MGLGKAVIVVLSVFVSQALAEKCQEGKMYPHPIRQSLFQLCVDGVKVDKECGGQMYFNKDLGNCFYIHEPETEYAIQKHARKVINSLGYLPIPLSSTTLSTLPPPTELITLRTNPVAKVTRTTNNPTTTESSRNKLIREHNQKIISHYKKRLLKKQKKKLKERRKHVKKTDDQKKNGVHISVINFEIYPDLAEELYNSQRPYAMHRPKEVIETDTDRSDPEAIDGNDSDDETTDSEDEDSDEDADEDSDDDESDSNEDDSNEDKVVNVNAEQDNLRTVKISNKSYKTPFDWNRQDDLDYSTFGSSGHSKNVSNEPEIKKNLTNSQADFKPDNSNNISTIDPRNTTESQDILEYLSKKPIYPTKIPSKNNEAINLNYDFLNPESEGMETRKKILKSYKKPGKDIEYKVDKYSTKSDYVSSDSGTTLNYSDQRFSTISSMDNDHDRVDPAIKPNPVSSKPGKKIHVAKILYPNLYVAANLHNKDYTSYVTGRKHVDPKLDPLKLNSTDDNSMTATQINVEYDSVNMADLERTLKKEKDLNRPNELTMQYFDAEQTDEYLENAR